MEEYKASSSSKFEPIMNKELYMILKSQMLRGWVLVGWQVPFTKSNRSWVKCLGITKSGSFVHWVRLLKLLKKKKKISNAQFN